MRIFFPSPSPLVLHTVQRGGGVITDGAAAPLTYSMPKMRAMLPEFTQETNRLKADSSDALHNLTTEACWQLAWLGNQMAFNCCPKLNYWETLERFKVFLIEIIKQHWSTTSIKGAYQKKNKKLMNAGYLCSVHTTRPVWILPLVVKLYISPVCISLTWSFPSRSMYWKSLSVWTA